MWSWIIKVTIFSLLLIFLIHYLYSFFKTTLTAPKLKDLVNKPQAKYNTIYKSLQNTADGGSANLGERDSEDKNNTVSKNMKMELMKYVKELSVGSGSNSTSDISSRAPNDASVHSNINYDALSNSNIINPQNQTNSIYSPANILSDTGANGISTRVNNNTKYMRDINNIPSHPTSASLPIDYGTPSMSSSYSSAYSPY